MGVSVLWQEWNKLQKNVSPLWPNIPASLVPIPCCFKVYCYRNKCWSSEGPLGLNIHFIFTSSSSVQSAYHQGTKPITLGRVLKHNFFEKKTVSINVVVNFLSQIIFDVNYTCMWFIFFRVINFFQINLIEK